MAAIRKELEQTAKITQARRESDEAFRTNLAKTISELSDDAYHSLSKKARAWADEAVNAYNDRTPIPEFPDEGEDSQEAERPSRGRRSQEADEGGEQPPEGEADMPTTHSEERGRGRRNPPPRSGDKNTSKDQERSSATERRASSSSKSKSQSRSSGNGEAKTGGLLYVRQLLCKDPDITVADLVDKVKGRGFAVSTQTLHTTRSGFRQDIKAMQEAGLLKKILID